MGEPEGLLHARYSSDEFCVVIEVLINIMETQVKDW
jgi:hypothetical protein